MKRDDFPILEDTVYGKRLVYLDNAATTQRPRAMVEAMNEAYYHHNANIHRGVHHLSQDATARHEQARQRVADYLNAHSAKEIIFTKGTTDSLNMLAFSFGEAFVKEGDEIVVSRLEHHSNIVPWQMMCERKKAHLKVLPLDANLLIDTSKLDDIITDRTRLVSVAQVSNVLGTVQPVDTIIRYCHEKNIPVCIDGAQSTPHMKVDMQALDCDFFVFSAHKMYGPTGLGILYGKEEWLNQLPPAEGGGEMIKHVSFEKTTYNVLPYKFEAGTPDFVSSCALAATMDYLTQIGREVIYTYEDEITRYLEEQLASIEGIHIYAQGIKKAGAVSFNAYHNDILLHPFDIGTLLDRQGVAVRTGHHCAEPLIDYLGIPGTVRASVAMYNTKEEVDILVSALKKAIAMLS